MNLDFCDFIGVTRREFLRKSAAVSIGAVFFLDGCNKRYKKLWGNKIDTLQNNAGPKKDGVNYKPLEGFVYDIEVEGKKVHVNLARDYFERRNHPLKYTIGDTSVCVFRSKVIVEDKNTAIINDPNVIQQATELTDLVLAALINKQNKLIKEREERYTAAIERAKLDLTYK